MSGHTPGPWKLKRDGVISDNEGRVVATTGYLVTAIADEDGPNARLIAAAPDLLAAHVLDVEAMTVIAREMEQGRFFAGSPGHHEWSRMAIRKAEVRAKAVSS